ncbi:EAL domain-containing protein [Telmatospirillum sp. J64-1]|uniref:sensor domain-containing phosphodiesterase n=1 Tax=Telmatospirillum sp. J64-1 TaxID=2502183 RepID=UPI00163D87C0|nr:EAL domain-containing protein [Telmatospirillum sp. J64-1]
MNAVDPSLRAQRDRFLAFAFAGADVLLELGPEGDILFAAGASAAIFGLADDRLPGLLLNQMTAEADRPTLAEALHRLRQDGRLHRIRLHFTLPDGTLVPTELSGIATQGPGGTVHLTVNHLRAAPQQDGTEGAGEPDSDGFADLVCNRLSQARKDSAGHAVTLVTLPLDPSQLATAEALLRAWSLGGDSVRRIGENSFGLLHEGTLDPATLAARLGKTLGIADPAWATVTLDAPLGQPDLLRCLRHLLGCFGEYGILPHSSLAETFTELTVETQEQTVRFRSLLEAEAIRFVFQPIVCLNHWTVLQYEALARIEQQGKLVFPREFLETARNLDLEHEVNLAICRRAIAVLQDNAGLPVGAKLALNLSTRSLDNSAFANKLVVMLYEHEGLLSRLSFEITESPEVQNLEGVNLVLRRLRSFGCKICLDDFGAGPSAFQSLRALEVDTIKIDGSYLLDAFDSRHGKPFLRAIAGMASEMHMKTIAAMVEQEKAVHLCREIGIDYGQGYYFSKPAEDVTVTTLPAKPFSNLAAPQLKIGR